METPKFVYTDGGKLGSNLHERCDCTVIALANARGIAYSDAHLILKNAGRKNSCKFRMTHFLDDIDYALPLPGPFHSTAKRFATEHPIGIFIVRVRGHVFAIINGVIHDNFDSSLKRIKRVWKIKPSS